MNNDYTNYIIRVYTRAGVNLARNIYNIRIHM